MCVSSFHVPALRSLNSVTVTVGGGVYSGLFSAGGRYNAGEIRGPEIDQVH